MIKLALFARLEAKPGKEQAVKEFLEMGLALANQETTTPIWFALKISESTFGVFDAFPDEERRLAHFNARWPQLQERAKALFVEGSLVMEKVDILGAKLPG